MAMTIIMMNINVMADTSTDFSRYSIATMQYSEDKIFGFEEFNIVLL